ncbi:MAG: polymerase, sigma-24 subunit, subfamily [Myxococcales bacterium]|nr:polymerase, sigma-24 subunit, subfamily [Myxococcales bacterium]
MEPDDKQLVEGARRGDAAAFRQLVTRHQRRAYAVALGMVHDPDDARDVCQEAFLKVHKNIGTFEGDAQFFTWLYRIVANLCIDHLRKKRGHQVEFDEALAHDDPDEGGIAPHRTGFDPARALSDKELRKEILAALDKLSPAHRTVLVMREVEGLSYQEMADTMKCSIGTIMSRLFHARKKMQQMLIAYRKAATPAA